MIGKGKIVSLTYTLRDAQGEIFEHTDVPISYLHGSGEGLFEKIERALEGLGVGDSVEVELSPAEGFGEHDPGLTFTDDIANVPPEYRRVGAEVEAENEQGEAIRFVVTAITDGRLTVDANHPLAGQTVRFAVTVQAVRDATPEEQRLRAPAPAAH
ncbi:peptidylprolyl isomerase [Acidiferrobacter sp.]|uniref:FKBP-type peptidyl-prolyl cis-trans isomerase n=1 Tax=Acidiferrobacter sp. TaxID=1872107 RepID=UPI002624DD7B|nr:peptidylprolyl isomerase [Acidiferrobacter sp.]